MIQSFSEQHLAAYLDQRDKRINGRFLADRIFRGTVRSVSRQYASGGTLVGWAYLVKVTRATDTATGSLDDTWYFCSVPGYSPQIGDVVDLIWRSASEAVVLQAVTFRQVAGRAWLNVNQGALASGSNTKITLDTISYDPYNMWDSINKWFKVPSSGLYLILGRVELTASITSMLASIGRNGTIDNTLGRGTYGGTEFGSVFAEYFQLNAGETIHLSLFQNSGAAQTATGGGLSGSTYLAIAQLGG